MLNKQPVSDDLDIIEIFLILWRNKWKVFIITTLFASAISIYYKMHKPTFTANTVIRPISTFNEFKYRTYNLYLQELKKKKEEKASQEAQKNIKKNNKSNNSESEDKSFQKIDKEYLINLFIDNIREGKIVRKAIKDLNLINKNSYKNDNSYESAVSRLALSIQLLPPVINNKKVRENWILRFKTQDREKWQEFLRYIEKPINNEIRNYLKKSFDELIQNEKTLINFKIEDLEQERLNAIDNYDRVTANRLIFLKEQADIARSLGIEEDISIEISKNLDINNSFKILFDKVNSNVPEVDYYKKGFKVIEFEIEQISERQNKEAFISELETIEKEKNKISSNRNIERLELLINNTPIIQSDNFVSANIDYITTKYKTDKNSIILVVLLASFIGLIIGVFYVIIENAIKSRL